MRSARGFNLVEAAVTVSVLGILMAAGLPSLSEWIRSTRVRSLAETLQNGLQKARSEAMKRNQVMTFWLVSPNTTARPDASCALSASSGAWVVSVDNPAGKCGAEPSTTEAPRLVEAYGPGEAGGSVVVRAVDRSNFEATSITFNAFGQPLPGTKPIASIAVEHTDASVRKLKIQISASGGIRMCDPAVTAPDSRACN